MKSNKSKILKLILIVLVLILVTLCVSKKNTNKTPKINFQNIEDTAPIPGEKLLIKHGFKISYNQSLKIANWVSYELTKDEVTIKSTKRSDNFKEDLDVSNPVRTTSYNGSGYDRGHLAPAADMAWSYESMNDSFYMTNMVPQSPELNRGEWKKLEELVREWAINLNSLIVVSGPILKDNLPKLLETDIPIPEKFFKAILDHQKPKMNAIGFIMNQNPEYSDLKKYAVTIDAIEAETKLDLFTNLPDNEEAVIESKIDLDQWSFKKTHYKLPKLDKINMNNNSEFNCIRKKTCNQMLNCEEAVFHLNVCGNTRLDGNSDGIPCQKLCN